MTASKVETIKLLYKGGNTMKTEYKVRFNLVVTDEDKLIDTPEAILIDRLRNAGFEITDLSVLSLSDKWNANIK